MEGATLADRLQKQVAGVSLIAGALLMAPTTYFEYSEETIFAAGVLGLIVYAILIPGLLGIAQLLRQRAPRLSVVAGLIATLGCVAGATFQTALLHEWAAREAGASEAMMAAIIDVTEERVFPVLVIFSILFPISLLTLGIGLLKADVVPTWVAALLVIGAILFPIGHIGTMQLITHLAESLLLIPMVWIGLRFLTGAWSRDIAVPATT